MSNVCAIFLLLMSMNLHEINVNVISNSIHTYIHTYFTLLPIEAGRDNSFQRQLCEKKFYQNEQSQ